MALTPYTGSWGKPQLMHLLRRTMFGVKKSDLTALTGQSMATVVAQLLSIPSGPPSPPVNDYSSSDPTTPLGSTWVDRPNDSADAAYQFQRIESIRAWWIGLMTNQPVSILEKMVLFWHNHIPINMGQIVANPFHCYRYNYLLREHALGNFKTLVTNMTTDLGMLEYLDGRSNTNTTPNENYSRELQELFTIGKDPNPTAPTYTQADIDAAARVLTGWRHGWPDTLQLYFETSKHDSTNKQFSSFYNNTIITGRADQAGARQEMIDLMNMIFAKDQVALNVVREIYRFFVYATIDATIESTIIVPLAATFRSNNYNILPVLQELFTSDHFYSDNIRRAQIKSALDFVVTMVRQNNIQPAGTDIVNEYGLYKRMKYAGELLTQEIGSPPSVSGWAAYYLSPGYHEHWITADTLRNRESIVDRIHRDSGYGTAPQQIKADAVTFTATLANPSDPNALIDEVIELFHTLPSQQVVKDALKAILLSGQSQDYYWTSAWYNYVSNPSDTAYFNTVNTRLRTFYKAVLKMAEYQLC